MCIVPSTKHDPVECRMSPTSVARKDMRERNTRLCALDTVQMPRDVSSRADLQQRMQGIVLLGIFLRVTPFQAESSTSEEQLLRGVEKSLRQYFGKRGARAAQDHLKAVERGHPERVKGPGELSLRATAANDRPTGLL